MNQSNLWNQLLEETLRSITQNNTMNTGTSYADVLRRDVSHNVAESTAPASEPLHPPDRTNPSSSSANIHPEFSPEYTIEDRTFDQLDTFITNMFTSVNNYHACIRQYNNNMNQFNRLFNTSLTLIAQNTQPSIVTTTPSMSMNPPPSSNLSTSFREFFLRNPGQFEIQGISIPLTNSSRQSSSRTTAYPSISQIYESTELFVYNRDTADRVHDTRCPISLEDFEYGEELCEIRRCHHVFKWTSLQNWFSRNTQCPVCRFDITTSSSSEDDGSGSGSGSGSSSSSSASTSASAFSFRL